MAGHNKWTQIKRQKGKEDASKSMVWGKFGKKIAMESKKANGDVNSPTLRALIENARKVNMPKDTIDRAIAKGISNDVELEAITYETYGPGGCAIMIDCLTDSRNRTAQEIKHLLSELGLALAAPGSASWAFDKTNEGYAPKTMVPLSEEDDKALMEILEKIDNYSDTQEVYTNAE